MGILGKFDDCIDCKHHGVKNICEQCDLGEQFEESSDDREYVMYEDDPADVDISVEIEKRNL